MERRSIFVLIDALGWDRVSETDFLARFSGTRRRLRTILGYSGACQSALFSGRPPSETGHWLMYAFTRRSETFAEARFLARLPRSLRNRGRLRRWLRSRVDRKIRGYYSLYAVPMEAFPHLELPDREDIYAPGGLAPARSILDDVSERGIPYAVWNWRIPEAASLEDLLGRLRRDEDRFYLIYWTRLDALMHEHGTRAAEVDAHIRWYEDAIDKIVDVSAKLRGETRVFVFSDHGMIDTRATVDLMGPIEAMGLAYGKDYAAFYDSTLARFVFYSDRARRAVESFLAAQNAGEVLSERMMKDLGVWYADGRFGELVFLTQPGMVIAPSYMGTSAPRAMHGFHPDAPGSDAHLVSNVDVGPEVRSVTGLYSVMKKELDA